MEEFFREVAKNTGGPKIHEASAQSTGRTNYLSLVGSPRHLIWPSYAKSSRAR